MQDIDLLVRDRIKTDDLITSYTTTDRIYPDVPGDNSQTPLLVYTFGKAEPFDNQFLDGEQPLRVYELHIDVWTQTAEQSNGLTECVVSRLHQWTSGAILRTNWDSWETVNASPDEYHRTATFRIWFDTTR